MAHVAQILTQEPIYKPSSIARFKLILLSAHKLILLIYGDNRKTGGLVTLLLSCPLPSFINGLQNFRGSCGGLHGVLGSRGAGAPSAPL